MRRLLLLMGLVIIASVIGPPGHGPRASGPMPHSLYVWQRVWGTAVRDSLADHGSAADTLVALAAEIAWTDGRPSIARVRIDYGALGRTGRPIGLALRIGPFRGPFRENDPAAQLVSASARQAVAEARAAGCAPAELQVDFDCPTAALGGYRLWVRAIAGAVAPTPVTVTALPAWLASPEFGPLARAAGGFVLQVHSLERPRLAEASGTLCDVPAAHRWVDLAARAGVPFRVALPTYGYLVVYGPDGRLLGLIAEPDAPELASGSTIREARADPTSLARLVRTWTADRPALLSGLIWYRMPVAGDRLNWSWPTLTSVMAGTVPTPGFAVRPRQPEPGLIELIAVNDGDADAALPGSVSAAWSGAGIIAFDALNGMDAAATANDRVEFARPRSCPPDRLRPGEELQLGWVRLAHPAEVTIDVRP